MWMGFLLNPCFFPKDVNQAWYKDLKAQLDEYKFDRVYDGSPGWARARPEFGCL